MIEVFTDGAAKGNPGPGGYGVILRQGQFYKELSGGFQYTTNNRMELLAVIVALETIKKIPSDIVVTSDSKYVVDAINKGWLKNWILKNFRNTKNPDLWIRFHRIYKQHRVQFKWIKGHNLHAENERCDQLAVAASMQQNLPKDEGYEASLKTDGLFPPISPRN